MRVRVRGARTRVGGQPGPARPLGLLPLFNYTLVLCSTYTLCIHSVQAHTPSVQIQYALDCTQLHAHTSHLFMATGLLMLICAPFGLGAWAATVAGARAGPSAAAPAGRPLPPGGSCASGSKVPFEAVKHPPASVRTCCRRHKTGLGSFPCTSACRRQPTPFAVRRSAQCSDDNSVRRPSSSSWWAAASRRAAAAGPAAGRSATTSLGCWRWCWRRAATGTRRWVGEGGLPELGSLRGFFPAGMRMGISMHSLSVLWAICRATPRPTRRQAAPWSQELQSPEHGVRQAPRLNAPPLHDHTAS